MNFLNKIISLIPLGKKEEAVEYFFALNIGPEVLTVALWSLQGSQLRILSIAADRYGGSEEILRVSDKLLDEVLGERAVEPKQILFGVPDHFLQDEDLKEEYLKLLRKLVKELELEPMAYVATSLALLHFLETSEGVPTTAILVGFDEKHLSVTVARAGKLDGTKLIERGESSGADIEKALLQFTDVETLPSKILIYGEEHAELEKLKTHLLSFTWMSKLSFLHFPKIETLEEEMAIKSVCLAGASEIRSDVIYEPSYQEVKKEVVTRLPQEEEVEVSSEDKETPETVGGNLGFIVGDVSEGKEESLVIQPPATTAIAEEEMVVKKFNWKRFVPKLNFRAKRLFIPVVLLAILILAYLFLPKAEVKIFVEPKVLEKDTQVVADPAVSSVNEESKIIPGEVVQTEVSGSAKDQASGRKMVGEAAKGTVVLRNKTDEAKIISKGTILTAGTGVKFTLDLSVTIASKSADDGTWGKVTAAVTASQVGADGNLPSETDLTVANLPTAQVIAKAEGNFSGGTSKEVTVVSDADQKRLLASLAADLRRQAKNKLQEEKPGKKILEEALAEEIIKKSYSKNVNDPSSEFSLNMTIKFKGTAFEEKDLKQIVGKLVTTQVPEGFGLDLNSTETQADVSKLEKDGKLIFLARFKAKLIPEFNEEEIKNKIKGRSAREVEEILKNMDGILGSEIRLTPSLPTIFSRVPLLESNIKLEVGLK